MRRRGRCSNAPPGQSRTSGSRSGVDLPAAVGRRKQAGEKMNTHQLGSDPRPERCRLIAPRRPWRHRVPWAALAVLVAIGARPGRGERGHAAGLGPVLHAAGEPGPVSARDDPARAAGDAQRADADRGRGRLPADVPHDQRHRPAGGGGHDRDGADLAGARPAAPRLLPDLLRQPHPELRALLHAPGRQQRRRDERSDRANHDEPVAAAGLGRRDIRL